MGKYEKLLEKIMAGRSDNNIEFSELKTLAMKLGFVHSRTTGSHNIYHHPKQIRINIQPNNEGKAKDYQIKDLRRIIKAYNLKLGDNKDV